MSGNDILLSRTMWPLQTMEAAGPLRPVMTMTVGSASGPTLDRLARPTLEALLRDSGWAIAEFVDGPRLPGGLSADHEARLQCGAARARLLVRRLRHPRPGALREWARSVEAMVGDDEEIPTAPALFTARVTPALARTLRELGVGYYDLYGACLLRWPGLFIDRDGQDAPIWGEEEWPGVTELVDRPGLSAQSVFGSRSLMRHRVLRVMLSWPERQWRQKDLAKITGVDPAGVHRVVSYLIQEHYADHEGRGPSKVVFLTRPGELLNTWAGYWREVWQSLQRAAGSFYSLGANPDAVKQDLIGAAAASGGRLGFTLAAGSDYFGAYLRDDRVHAYFGGNGGDLARRAGLDAVDRGANVVLLPLRDEGLLYLPQPVETGDAPHAGPVCPVQLYLDMRAAGGRYAEQAEALRSEVVRH